jgi:hypothetical protein
LFFGVPVCRIKHYFGSHDGYFFGVHSVHSTSTERMNLAAPMYFTYREPNQSFEKFGVWNSGTAGVTGLGDPEQIARGSVVTLRYE